MLDFYFDSTVRRRQLRRGPLAEHLDGLAAEFQQISYGRHSARRHLSIIGQFSGYLGLLGLAVDDVDERIAERFLAEMRVADGRQVRAAMRWLLSYLRDRGIIAPLSVPAPHPFARILEGYERYQRDVRGLAASTRNHNVRQARILIDWLCERYGHEALVRLAGTDVLEFITDRVGRYRSRSSRGHVCSQARGFLRYLYSSGTIAADLERTVPRVSTPRLASLPRALPWEQVRAVIDGIDTSHSDGLRDKAMLLLLATLGLRSNEMRTLELGSSSGGPERFACPGPSPDASASCRSCMKQGGKRAVEFLRMEPGAAAAADAGAPVRHADEREPRT